MSMIFMKFYIHINDVNLSLKGTMYHVHRD